MEVIASLIYTDDDDYTDLHIDNNDGFDDDHGKNLSHHHHHTDHHILHQDNSRTRVKARAGNTGTAKDYQRPQPTKQVMLMNRDDDEHNDNAGAGLRSAPRF